jgi:hypothetical protein
LPVKLEEIINKALEKDRKLRYQSAAEMAVDLKRLQREIDSGRTGVGPGPSGELTAWLNGSRVTAGRCGTAAGRLGQFYDCTTPKEPLQSRTLDPGPHGSSTLVMESNLQQRQFCVWSKLHTQAAHYDLGSLAVTRATPRAY